MRRIIILFMAAVAFALCGCLAMTGCGDSVDNGDTGAKAEINEALTVDCYNGNFAGVEKDGVISFKGIPYAQQPVGDLRWKAPVKAEESDETILCDEYGNVALQYEWPTEPASYSPKGEDCLTLNIWTNNLNPDKKKPVMVWIHGGAYGWGGATDPMYDGQNFIKANGDDVILVTIQYRLGLMAWPDFSQVPGGEDYTDGMLGIRDQIMALEWIQDNIEGFGGDRNNVTLFGESAGSTSVGYLMMSPMADGLFHKAIQESAGIATDARNWNTRKEAQEYADLLMETAGCKNMEELLAVDAKTWVDLDTENWLADESPNEYIDGDVIPEDVSGAWEAASKKGIPLLVGTTADERYYDVEEDEGIEGFTEHMNAKYKEQYGQVSDESKKIMDEYMASEDVASRGNPWDIAKFQTEMFRAEVYKEVDEFVNNGGTAYMYYWDVPSNSETYNYGACHAVELSYVLNNTDDEIYAGPDQDLEVAAKAQEAWVNFAKTGNPSIESTEWPAYTPDNRTAMHIVKGDWKAEEHFQEDIINNMLKVREDILNAGYKGVNGN